MKIHHASLFLTVLTAVAAVGQPAGLTVGALRCEHLINPAGLDTVAPRLGWQVASLERGQRQSAWRVLVASSAAALAADRGDRWDSGRVADDRTVDLAYAGAPLASGAECHWKVMVWDRDGKPSPWSAPARWSMGLLQPGDWKAEWIGTRDPSPVHRDRATLYLPPARLYRGDFAATGAVRRAVLYASALGIADWYVNGRRVDDAWFGPGWADYRLRAYYRAYDVTALVAAGSNRLGAVLADGWYAGYVGYALLVGYGPYQAGRNLYGKTPALLGQLEIEYADGRRATVATGPGWQVSDAGPWREADLLMGETYDARREQPDWCKPGAAGGEGWAPAIRAAEQGRIEVPFHDNCGDRTVDVGFVRPARLQAYSGPPVRTLREIRPPRIVEQKPGVFIADLGENVAGNIRLRAQGPAGTTVRIRYGEMLHPDGRLMTENLRKARATDTWILRGDPAGETWSPRFTYHGFQYVELTGLPAAPTPDTVTGLVLNSDTPPAGEFACSDELLNKLYGNIRRTQFANFVEVPTDCPQRDERLGWMGDAAAYVRSATMNADVEAFFTKWLDDVEEAQRPEGPYPDYCPYPMGHGQPGKTFGTAWTDAGLVCPWTIWRVYGDTGIVARHWASMTRFMEWRKRMAPELRGVDIGNPWGDWLNINETTPIPFIDAAYFAHDAELMADLAAAVGKAGEATAYRKLHGDIAARFCADYLKGDGLLSVDTQSAYALVLAFDLLPVDRRQKAADRLAAKIAANGNRMATGFLGTKLLLPVLSAHGHHDLAARLFQSRAFPSWGYEVENGATSVWERWDSYTKADGFGRHNAAMNSFSHYAFGAVCEWMFRDLAGLDTDGPGFARLLVRPGPPTPGSNPERDAISWVKTRYDSIRGPVALAWRREAGRFTLELTVPANTTATVLVPTSDRKSVQESGAPVAAAAGVKFLRMEGAAAVYEVGSGTYQFTSQLPK